MTGEITQDFGGEVRRFLVRLGELRKIQAKCDAGPGEIASRLARTVAVLRTNPSATLLDLLAMGVGPLHPDDVREPIFQGLISGGASPNDAGRLCTTWIDERGFKGLLENAELALTLVVSGVDLPDDIPIETLQDGAPVGEPEAGAASATSPAANGTSAASTAQAPRSTSPRAKSMK